MFSAGKTLALALQPSPYLSEAQARQAETTEAYRLLSVKPNVGVGGAHDVRPLVRRARRGDGLVPGRVIAGAPNPDCGPRIAADHHPVRAKPTRVWPTWPAAYEPCPGVVSEIGGAIDERGEVKSSASPALARIRKELEVAHSRLLDKLNRILTSTQSSQYLQEALITQRAGRYVVPLKADFQRQNPGGHSRPKRQRSHPLYRTAVYR